MVYTIGARQLEAAVRLIDPSFEPVLVTAMWNCTEGEHHGEHSPISVRATFWRKPDPPNLLGQGGRGWCDDCIRKKLRIPE